MSLLQGSVGLQDGSQEPSRQKRPQLQGTEDPQNVQGGRNWMSFLRNWRYQRFLGLVILWDHLNPFNLWNTTIYSSVQLENLHCEKRTMVQKIGWFSTQKFPAVPHWTPMKAPKATRPRSAAICKKCDKNSMRSAAA